MAKIWKWKNKRLTFISDKVFFASSDLSFSIEGEEVDWLPVHIQDSPYTYPQDSRSPGAPIVEWQMAGSGSNNCLKSDRQMRFSDRFSCQYRGTLAKDKLVRFYSCVSFRRAVLACLHAPPFRHFPASVCSQILSRFTARSLAGLMVNVRLAAVAVPVYARSLRAGLSSKMASQPAKGPPWSTTTSHRMSNK